MKILFVTKAPVNKSISSGNTFLNVFEGISDVECASVFMSNGLPDTCIKKAFRITEKMILKRLLLRSKTVGDEELKRYSGENVMDNHAVRFAKKNRWTIFFWLQNLIWSFPVWKSGKLKTFLDEYQPDVIVSLLNDSQPMNRLVRYIVQYTKKPLMLYAWDDNYTVKSVGKSILKRLWRLRCRVSMRKTIKISSKLYVISKIQKQDFELWFGKDCKILTKSADFSRSPLLKQEYGKPLQLIYTGNIGLNRWKSLHLIVQALRRLNEEGTKAVLRIYTGNYCDETVKAALNVENCSRLMGSVSAEEVKTLQEEADILVHVESLDKADCAKIRQSFSTKLVDYFKATRPILAVGPDGIASMEHLKENDCAMTAKDVDTIYRHLVAVTENPRLLNTFALKAYECGKSCHDKQAMSALLAEGLHSITQ